MTLRRMRVTDFRCLHSAELEFDSRLTLISGPNASGKTSILESVYLLGRGRSFRTRRLDAMIRSGTDRFIAFGEVENDGRRVGLGVEGMAQGIRAKVGGDRVSSLAELALELPAQIIDPDVHGLIEEGPTRRRRFLDWGVFHVEHAYVGHWQRYQKVLQQRNAALRTRLPLAVVNAWDSDLLMMGLMIDDARGRYVAQLEAAAAPIAHRLLGLDLALTYRSGWAKELSFEAALAASIPRDLELGSTSVGPQRAEMTFRLGGLPVKDRISRGQQKLLASALLIAQVMLIAGQGRMRPTLLLDDPAAELDGERLRSLIAEVAGQAVQLVVTSLSEEFDAFGAPGKRYRLMNGQALPQ